MAKASTPAAPEAPSFLPISVANRRRNGEGRIAAPAFTGIAAIVLLTPFSLVAAHAAQDPSALLIALENPVAAVQLTLALVVALAFVTLPLIWLLRRARAPHQFEIDDQGVTAMGPGGKAIWTEPLGAYRGVAHHVRSSLSGAQHEIVLVNTDPAKSVVLHVADRIAQSELDRIAGLLALPEISPRLLYQRGSMTDYSATALGTA